MPGDEPGCRSRKGCHRPPHGVECRGAGRLAIFPRRRAATVPAVQTQPDTGVRPGLRARGGQAATKVPMPFGSGDTRPNPAARSHMACSTRATSTASTQRSRAARRAGCGACAPGECRAGAQAVVSLQGAASYAWVADAHKHTHSPRTHAGEGGCTLRDGTMMITQTPGQTARASGRAVLQRLNSLLERHECVVTGPGAAGRRAPQAALRQSPNLAVPNEYFMVASCALRSYYLLHLHTTCSRHLQPLRLLA